MCIYIDFQVCLKKKKKNEINKKWLPGSIFVTGGIHGNALHRKSEIFYADVAQWNTTAPLKQARCGHISVYMGHTQWKNVLQGSTYKWKSASTVAPPGRVSSLSLDRYVSELGALNVTFEDWKMSSGLSCQVFVGGGRREHGVNLTSCEVYNIEQNRWHVVARAPFSNDGYQSGCWWGSRSAVAMAGGTSNDDGIALFHPSTNRWETFTHLRKSVTNSFPTKEKHSDTIQFNHFSPVLGTVWLHDREYLYLLGDDYKFKTLEIFDDRCNQFIPIGISMVTVNGSDSQSQMRDQLYNLTKKKQFDCFLSCQ
ncbi:hypothetical protein RFI_14393 [Reticulomyxa filosa]|uniref:Uncharacterized protein n=1 Tax=Reticulomyxa filosa TaxID=46433 RepID=X6NAK5_RETFI|nr:hypothetical protein RFI_14393 [Reticulomyxa filosa]|eukprot:ETO22799.1 hypothetical protein RFI_14393 [Reticulomyxa filosa]